MNETQKRISEYKKSLPKIKEKIAGMIVLLIVAATMLTTVTFAWTTLSINPEVRGATTSLTSNGNLEIALATGTNAPGATQLGDGEKELVDRNITWGNLINLSDPSYGLEHFVLRPAQLNPGELNTNPLYGAEYDEFGRVVKLNTEFGYARWKTDESTGVSDFVALTSVNDLGVRVISSITQSFEGEQKVYRGYYSAVKEANLTAATMYAKLKDNSAQMQSLASMMGLYMTARMNPDEESLNNPECSVEDIQNLRDMYAGFKEAFEAEAHAIALLLNFQNYVLTGTYTEVYTAEEVLALSSAKITQANSKFKVQKFDEFVKDYKTISSDLEKLEEIVKAGGTIKWQDSGLNTIVNNLVNVGECTIGSDNTPIKNIGASNAASYISGTQEARITNGILYRFEERTGGYIEVKGLSISAKVKRYGITIPASVKANIQTTASRDYNLFTQDLVYADKELFTGNFEGQGTMVANDTYGLAIDFWIRTNAVGSYLTLEGNVLTKTETVRDTTMDMNGNEVELWTITETIAGEDGTTTTVDILLYQIITQETDQATGKITEKTEWYVADNHVVYRTDIEVKTVAQDGTETIESKTFLNASGEEIPESDAVKPIGQMKELVTVIGYEGENRVWEDKEGLSITNLSTTQGSGSCYVFYASPEDQSRFLNLLQYLKIAFVSEDGKLLTTAIMDTEHYFADEGKVIVPVVLDSNSPIAGTKANGDPIYGITALEQNVATRITAIVYLDGMNLNNSDVLSSADIQGMMNIQFGSSADLGNADNEELRLKEITVSAELDKTEFSFGDTNMTTNITVDVGNDQPKTMKAFFIRAINATQGTREDTITFTYDEGSGKWKAAYTFTSPGTYILRSVEIDGTDRELTTPKTVTIEGFAISSLNWGEVGNNVTVRSAKNSYSQTLELKFATNDFGRMPSRVEGNFIREDGTVANALFTYNTTSATWTANVKFAQSGKYSLQYLIVDGEYQELDASMQKFINLYLGMKVSVFTTSPTSIKFDPATMQDNEKNLAIQVKIVDDGGTVVAGLQNVSLVYNARGSVVNSMQADLKWNSVSGYYEGTFDASSAGVSVYAFSSLSIGQDTITNAISAVTFTFRASDPPSFIGATLDTNGKGVTALIKNSSTTTVVGYFEYVGKDGTSVAADDGTSSNKIIEIQGVHSGPDENGISTWKFAIPEDEVNEGYWKFVEIKIWNYTDKYEEDHLADLDANGNIIPNVDKDGKPIAGVYRDPNPMIFDEEDEGWQNDPAMVVRHSNKVYVTFNKNNGKNKYEGNEFMVPYAVDGTNLSVIFADFVGEPIKGITQPQLIFTYEVGTEYTYGQYRVPSDKPLSETISISLISTDGLNYSLDLSTVPAFSYAGEYTAKITYVYNGKNEEIIINKNDWKVMVYTNKPTVTIDSISPSGSHTTVSSAEENVTVTSKIEGNKVTIYPKSTVSDDGCNKSGNIEIQPSVTLKLNGIGNADNAQLIFTSDGSSVYLYTGQGSGQTDAYIWESNGTVTRYVGNYANGCSNATPAGTLTSSNKLILTVGDRTIEVDIDVITIVNITP